MLEDRSYMREPSFRSGRSAVVILLIVNAVAFIAQLAVDRFTSFDIGSYFALSLKGLQHGYVWQFVTYQFLHGGWLHLILNCWVIYVFGRAIEEALGWRVFVALYLGSGVFGGMLQELCALAFGPNSHFAASVVGASAGAFGLLAAYAVLAPERVLTLLLFFVLPVSLRAKYLLYIGLAMAVVGMVLPTDNIAHAAHLGGMLGGIFVVRYAIHWHWRWPWPSPRLRSPTPRRLVKVPSDSRLWSHGKTVDADDLPNDEFLAREVDPILDKISAQGIHSLTERERRVLEKARSKVGKR